MARYAIGKLYRPPKSENVEDSSISECSTDLTGTIGGLEAMNFVTVATPHLGSRGHKQVCALFIHSLRVKISEFTFFFFLARLLVYNPSPPTASGNPVIFLV